MSDTCVFCGGSADRPEPPPVQRGVPVTPHLLAWLSLRGHHDAAVLVRRREAFGRRKYGQPLLTEDGRNTVHDAEQEIGDALQYAMSAKMQGLDITRLRQLVTVLAELVHE